MLSVKYSNWEKCKRMSAHSILVLYCWFSFISETLDKSNEFFWGRLSLSTPISLRILLSCCWAQRRLEYRSPFFMLKIGTVLDSFIYFPWCCGHQRTQCLLVFFLQDYGSLCFFICIPHITAPVWPRPVTSSFTMHSWGAVSCHDKSGLIVHLSTRGHPSADRTLCISFLFYFFSQYNLTQFTLWYLVHTLLT